MSLSIIEKYKERKLQERLKNKDKLAFEELYDKNIDDIYRFIYFKVAKKEEASDLSSLVFLKTWEYLQNNSIKEVKTLRALLYKIARNAVIDYYRSQRPENLSIDDQERPLEIVDWSHDLEGEISIKVEYHSLLEKIMELKNEYREILIMRFVNELSLEEIADISGKKKINVRVLLHRALKALKDLIGEKNPEEPQK